MGKVGREQGEDDGRWEGRERERATATADSSTLSCSPSPMRSLCPPPLCHSPLTVALSSLVNTHQCPRFQNFWHYHLKVG